MKKPSNDSRVRQQIRRARLREAGLVLREVWVHPGNAVLLLKLEKVLRQPNPQPLINALKGVNTAMSDGNASAQALLASLSQGPLVKSGNFSAELLDGVDPVIHVTAHISVIVAATSEIIIVQAALFAVADVADEAALNAHILRTEKFFDLANISIDRHPDGSEHYVIYGALRCGSSLEDIEYEIDTLARNAVDAASAYREFLI